jgi:hypothetical protein
MPLGRRRATPFPSLRELVSNILLTMPNTTERHGIVILTSAKEEQTVQ